MRWGIAFLGIGLVGCTAMLPFKDKKPSDASVDDVDLDTAWDTGHDTPTDDGMDVDTLDTVDPDADLDPDTVMDPDVDPDTDPPMDTAVEDVPVDGEVPGTWVMITAGTFTMGSPDTELGRDPAETQHQVTLTHSFQMMATEVTQKEYHTFMGDWHSYFGACGENCPVEQVNWYEAAAYANEVSATAGFALCYTCTGSGSSVTCEPNAAYATPYECPGYRLPTEAEWEYAARAGATTGTYNGNSTLTGCENPNPVLDPIAWFCGNSIVTYPGCFDLSSSGGPSCAGPNPVGMKAPNAWGLYDMLGNVYEWCYDRAGGYSGTVTDPWGPPTGSWWIFRGGSFAHRASWARAAYRNYGGSGHGNQFGFRLVRTL